MAWFPVEIGQTGGDFTKTRIVYNANESNTLIFTSDYHNYDFLEFVTFNFTSYYFNTSRFITSPEILDDIFQYSDNMMTLDDFNSNQYVTYVKTSDLIFTKAASRNLNCIAVYGIKCTKTVNKTAIYRRQAIGSSDVAITSVDSLFDYDMLLFSACTGSTDETIICAYPVYKDESYIVRINKYNNYRIVTISEHDMTAYQYFYVQGIKFS